MKRITCIILLLLAASTFSVNAETDSSSSSASDSAGLNLAYFLKIDSLLKSFNYQSGHINVGEVAAVDVPEGFKFLSAKDAQEVLTTF